MNVRLAKLSEKEEIKKLWEYCFYDTDPYLSWFFGMFNEDNTVVAEESGKIAAALQMIPYVLMIKGKKYFSYYLCGVSVAPEFRGGGTGRKILDFAAEISKQRGAAFNMLIPALEGFYEKCGYEKCFEKLEFEINPKRLPPKTAAEFCRITDENIEMAANIYAEYARDFGCYIERTPSEMKKILSQYNLYTGGGYLINGAQGYFLYYIEGGVMHIDEAVCLNENAMNALLNFVYRHHSQIKSAVIRTASADALAHKLSSVEVVCKKMPTVMMRPLENIGSACLFTGQIDGASARRLGISANGDEKIETSFVNIL